TVAPTPAPTTLPSATPGQTPGPTPTSPDVSQLFLPKLALASSGQFVVTGSRSVGTSQGEVTGSLTFLGRDSEQSMTIPEGSVAATTTLVHRDGIGYTKVGDGPWIRDPVRPVEGTDLASFLQGVTAVVDAGVAAHDGVQAHRLELPAGTVIPGAAF